MLIEEKRRQQMMFEHQARFNAPDVSRFQLISLSFPSYVIHNYYAFYALEKCVLNTQAS